MNWEKLVAPPEFVLPKKGIVHKPHPLLELSKLSSAQAVRAEEDGGFNIRAAL